jgi:hypothetical protein
MDEVKLLWACAIGTPKPTPSRAQPFAVRPLAKRSFRIRRLLRVARGRCLLFEGNIFGGHLRFPPILPQSRHQDDSLFHPSTARSENAFGERSKCDAETLLLRVANSFHSAALQGLAPPLRSAEGANFSLECWMSDVERSKKMDHLAWRTLRVMLDVEGQAHFLRADPAGSHATLNAFSPKNPLHPLNPVNPVSGLRSRRKPQQPLPATHPTAFSLPPLSREVGPRWRDRA